MDIPLVVRCDARSSVCVVLPDLSRPSMTMNAPRAMMITVMMISKDTVILIGSCDAMRVRDCRVGKLLLFRSFQLCLLLISPSSYWLARRRRR